MMIYFSPISFPLSSQGMQLQRIEMWKCLRRAVVCVWQSISRWVFGWSLGSVLRFKLKTQSNVGTGGNSESNVYSPFPQSVSWWVQSLPGAEGGEVEGWRSSGCSRRGWGFIGQEEIATCSLPRQQPLFPFFWLDINKLLFLDLFLLSLIPSKSDSTSVTNSWLHLFG